MIGSIFCQPLASQSPQEILAYYKSRNNVEYFPVIDEEETTKEKIDRIVFDGCFSFNNEAYVLKENFDWKNNPSKDIEWLILLHKFYYAVGLGIYYHECRDLRYAKKWIELTESWIETVPINFLTSDVAGRRIQNWIFAHYFFVSANADLELSSDFYCKFLISIYEQTNHLCQNLTPARNHRTLELYAIFLVAVVFPEFKDAGRWLQFSIEELVKNILSDLNDDGVHCEQSTDYHHLVLKNYLGIRRLAKLNGIEMPREMDDRIKKALEFSMYVHRPDGSIPSLSDGDSRCFFDLLRQGFDLYKDERMLYVATKGKHGTPPDHRSKAFPKSGYYIQRSGWGQNSEAFEDARYLIFDCGPLGQGNHGHFDLLSIEVAAYGKPLIVDPGRYTYDESGEINWRVLFRGTGYHNTIQIDGMNQTRYEFHKTRFKIRGPEPEFELKKRLCRTNFEFLHGHSHSYEYDVIHERMISFVDRKYWIITDVVTGQETHDYNLRFHLSHEAFSRTTKDIGGHTILINAPNLILAQSRKSASSIYVDDGYISQTYGVKYPAPIVRYNESNVKAVFNTVIYPYKAEIPEISLLELDVLENSRVCERWQATALCITGSVKKRKIKDYFFYCSQGHVQQQTDFTFGDFSYNGNLLMVRQQSDDHIDVLYCDPQKTLTSGGRKIPLRKDTR